MSYEKWVQREKKVSKEHTSTFDNARIHLPLDGKRSPQPKQEMPQKDDESVTWPPLSSQNTSLTLLSNAHTIEGPTTHKPPMALERTRHCHPFCKVFHPPQFLEVVLKWDSAHVGFLWTLGFPTFCRSYDHCTTSSSLHIDYSILVCMLCSGVTLC